LFAEPVFIIDAEDYEHYSKRYFPHYQDEDNLDKEW
jgi:hypothetical protein